MTGPEVMSERQLIANRANAQLSTGPRIPEGKAMSSRNALRHGLLSNAVIPQALEPDGSRAASDALLAALREDLAPATTIEEMLVGRIAVAYWRLGRLLRAEAGAIAARRDLPPSGISAEDRASLPPNSFYVRAPLSVVEKDIGAIESVPSNKRALQGAMVARSPEMGELSDDELRPVAEGVLDALRKQKVREDAHRGAVRDAERSLPHLDLARMHSRYETALQRQIDRGLAQLERLQRMRGGKYLAPPLQVDVDVSEIPSVAEEWITAA